MDVEILGYWDTGILGYWILDTGYWILDTGYWILDTGILGYGSLYNFSIYLKISLLKCLNASMAPKYSQVLAPALFPLNIIFFQLSADKSFISLNE